MGDCAMYCPAANQNNGTCANDRCTYMLSPQKYTVVITPDGKATLKTPNSSYNQNCVKVSDDLCALTFRCSRPTAPEGEKPDPPGSTSYGSLPTPRPRRVRHTSRGSPTSSSDSAHRRSALSGETA